MLPVILFLISIGLQLTAALAALLLIRTTGRKLAWILLSIAMMLMAWRRILSFVSLLSAGKTIVFDFPELIALIISCLMLAGVLGIGAYFRSIRTAAEERNRAEDALRALLTRQKTIMEAVPDIVMEVDDKKVYTWANPAGYEFFGEDVIGKEAAFYFQGEQKTYDMVEPIFKGNENIIYVESWQRRRDGEKRLLGWWCRVLKDENGRVTGALSSARDITEYKLAEEQLRLDHEIIANVNDGVYLVRLNDGVILWTSRQFDKMFGYNPGELIGKHVSAVNAPTEKSPKEKAQGIIEELDKHGIWHGEVLNIKKDGTTFWCDAVVTKMILERSDYGAVWVSAHRDITERMSLEEQLRHAQKMETIGTLAGGVAHEFNNILTAIMGYGSIVLMNMKQDDPQRQNIENMIEGTKRAAHLTSDLLLFSRKQVSDRKPVDLNNVVRKVEKFLKTFIGEDIECRTHLEERPITVLADPHQLEQVLINLATNARDSMPKGGVFICQTEQVNLNEDFIAAQGYGKPGPYAMMTVSDAGMGMDEETRLRIFEPFFSTKEVGKGTGLGLAVVYGIIKQHDGTISVYSGPGQGTTFRIYLPSIQAEVKEEKREDEEEPSVGGTETILVAEDDESVRKLYRVVLNRFGYTLIEAVDGEDAVRKFTENKESIHLLVLDLIMPKMNGKEAYDEILKIKPGIKALFISGYSADILQREKIAVGGQGILLKPVTPDVLLSKIREMIDG